MQLGRIPAQIVVNLEGETNNLSGKHNVDADIMHQMGVCQQPLVSNSILHVPTLPALFTPPIEHKKRSLAIVEAIKKLAIAYFKPNKSLESLQNHEDTGNQVKSQRREACIALLQVMLYYVDDATGRVGRALDNGKFKDLSLKQLAEFAGINFKRAKRAMRDIVSAGYLRVVKQFTRDPEGRYIGLPSIREFLPKFFTALDVTGELWQKWFTLKGWKREREAKKETKQDRKKAKAALGYITESLKAGGRKVKNKFNGLVNKFSGEKAKSPALLNHEKGLISKSLELFKLDSSKSVGDYHRMLQDKYPPPTK